MQIFDTIQVAYKAEDLICWVHLFLQTSCLLLEVHPQSIVLCKLWVLASCSIGTIGMNTRLFLKLRN